MERYELEIGGKVRQYAVVETAVAVAPDKDLKKRNLSKSQEANYFGRPADDDRKGPPGVVLPYRQRKAFEKAGWIFAEPTESIRKSAALRTRAERAEAVREVCFDENGEPKLTTDYAIVRLQEGYTGKRALAQLRQRKFTRVQPLDFGNRLYEVRLPPKKNALRFVQELQQARPDAIETIEPVFLENLGLRFRPDDARYSRQWQWNNVDGHHVSAERAWDHNRGRGVRLAVIDLGFHIENAEFQDAIVGGGFFTETGRGTSTFTRLVPGRTFPAHPHGTFCAAQAGARLNSRAGCGMAPESDLILIACPEIASQATLAKAIQYAVSGRNSGDAGSRHHRGADVISCSLGPDKDFALTDVLRQALDFAVQEGRPAPAGSAGTPVFWAVSNSNVKISRDEVCSYPHTITVGQSDSLDKQGGSAFGSELDFLAPGKGVVNTTGLGGNQTFAARTGTSYATPIAAGVAALMLAKTATLSWGDIRNRMRASCDKIDSDNARYSGSQFGGHSLTHGFGRVNAQRAVDKA